MTERQRTGSRPGARLIRGDVVRQVVERVLELIEDAVSPPVDPVEGGGRICDTCEKALDGHANLKRHQDGCSSLKRSKRNVAAYRRRVAEHRYPERPCSYCTKLYWPKTETQQYCQRKCTALARVAAGKSTTGNRTKKDFTHQASTTSSASGSSPGSHNSGAGSRGVGRDDLNRGAAARGATVGQSRDRSTPEGGPENRASTVSPRASLPRTTRGRTASSATIDARVVEDGVVRALGLVDRLHARGLAQVLRLTTAEGLDAIDDVLEALCRRGWASQVGSVVEDGVKMALWALTGEAK